EERSRDRDDPDQYEDRGDRPDPDGDQALGHRGRKAESDLSEYHEHDGGEAEEEHHLADRARVPADHGDGRPVPVARVPPGQRRHREQQPEEESQSPAHAGQLAGAWQRHTATLARALHRVKHMTWLRQKACTTRNLVPRIPPWHIRLPPRHRGRPLARSRLSIPRRSSVPTGTT